jgi:hypothetical protein
MGFSASRRIKQPKEAPMKRWSVNQYGETHTYDLPNFLEVMERNPIQLVKELASAAVVFAMISVLLYLEDILSLIMEVM